MLDLCSWLIRNTQSVVRPNSSHLVPLHRRVFCTERSLHFLSEQVWRITLLAKARNFSQCRSFSSIPPFTITDFSFCFLKTVFLFQVWQDFGGYLEELVTWWVRFFPPSQFLEPFARDSVFGGSSASISVPRLKQEDEAGTASSHPGHFRVLVSSWEVSSREFMKWSFLFCPSLAVKCRLEDYLYHLTNM